MSATHEASQTIKFAIRPTPTTNQDDPSKSES